MGSTRIYTNLYHSKDKADSGQEYWREGAKKGDRGESGAKSGERRTSTSCLPPFVIDGRLRGDKFVGFYFGILLYLYRLSSVSHELA